MLYLTYNKEGWNKMGRVKRKAAFKHAQHSQIHIFLHMRKVSSGHLLFIETFCSLQWFCLRTAKALIRLRECAGWSGLSLSAYAWRRIFAGRGPHTASRGLKWIIFTAYAYLPMHICECIVMHLQIFFGVFTRDKARNDKINCAVPPLKFYRFSFLRKNMRCGYSLEAPQRGASNEYHQRLCTCRNKKHLDIWVAL